MEVDLPDLCQLDAVLGALHDEVVERIIESVDKERVVAGLGDGNDGGGECFDMQNERVVEMEFAGVEA